jgi:hypothetical protein
MKRSIRRAMAVAVMMQIAVGTASHEMEAQSKKATTPTEVAPAPLGLVKYTRPPSVSLKVAQDPVGSCYAVKDCQGEPVIVAYLPKDLCVASGGKSWRQELPLPGACQNL